MFYYLIEVSDPLNQLPYVWGVRGLVWRPGDLLDLFKDQLDVFGSSHKTKSSREKFLEDLVDRWR